MRQRLIDEFVVVGDCHFCSISATKREVEETGQDVMCYLYESIRHIVWYILVLASEYRLLKLQNQTIDGTVMELYYALNAILRLDRYSEFILFKEIDPTTLNSDNPSTYSVNLSWERNYQIAYTN